MEYVKKLYHMWFPLALWLEFLTVPLNLTLHYWHFYMYISKYLLIRKTQWQRKINWLASNNCALQSCTGPEQGQNRARTGPEQGFLCVVILTGKNLFSLQGTPLFIAGILCSLQGCPCENYYTGLSFFTSQIQFAFQLTL